MRVNVLRSLLCWLALALLCWLDSAHPTISGEYTGAFLPALFTAIASAFAWLADKAVTIAVVIYHATVIAGRFVWDVAVRIAGVFRDVYGFLRQFWTHVLRPFVQWVWRSIDRLAGWLRRTVEPVLDFLFRVRRELLKLYERFIRPVLDTIGVIRRLLQLLALLRIDWARELDRHLAELEDRLLVPIRFALGKLNEVINIVNSVASGFGVLQRIALVRSVFRDVYLLDDAWREAFHGPVTSAERKKFSERPPVTTGAEIGQGLRDYFSTGEGEYGPGARELAAEIRIAMRRAA